MIIYKPNEGSTMITINYAGYTSCIGIAEIAAIKRPGSLNEEDKPNIIIILKSGHELIAEYEDWDKLRLVMDGYYRIAFFCTGSP